MQDEIDGLLPRREVCRLAGYGPRWLSELIRTKRFPPPDVPAPVRGSSDKWRVSTVKRHLDELQRQAQAKRDTGPQPAA